MRNYIKMVLIVLTIYVISFYIYVYSTGILFGKLKISTGSNTVSAIGGIVFAPQFYFMAKSEIYYISIGVAEKLSGNIDRETWNEYKLRYSSPEY